MSLTSYRTAPPRVPRGLNNAPALSSRKRFLRFFGATCQVSRCSDLLDTDTSHIAHRFLKLAATAFASMLPAVHTVNVSLGARSYPIHISPGLLGRLGTECARLELGRRCAIISDRNVAKHYARAAQASLRKAGFESTLIVVPPGETAKRVASVEFCY